MCAFTQCRRGEDFSSGLRETIVAVQSGKGYEAISKQFEIHHPPVWKIIHKWKAFKTAAYLARSGHFSKFTLNSDHEMLRETTKKGKEKKRIKSPRATSQTVPASDWMLNVKLHGSKIRKRLEGRRSSQCCNSPKSRPRPQWNAVVTLKKMLADLYELKQHCKEEWAKMPQRCCKRLIKCSLKWFCVYWIIGCT